MKATILTIGDEIINGATLDTNATFIASKSEEIGIDIVKILSVSDKEDEIIDGLSFLSKKSDIIFITGGLGPTKDDITIKTLAKFLDVPLEFNQDVYNRINRILSSRTELKIEINKSQCEFPKGTVFLDNKKGTAPCLWLKKDKAILVSMPGVPHEMKQIFVDEVLVKIKTNYSLEKKVNEYILTAGIWESVIEKKIKDIVENLPKGLNIAYLPKLGQVTLRLSGFFNDKKKVKNIILEISERLGNHVYSFNKEANLANVIGEKLLELGKTLSTAESCTGGKIAHKITKNAGSSSYFQGSIISYSNTVKMKSLSVKLSTLKKYGAVSQQTVVEMVKGVLTALNTDYGVAVSGIAGPTGGTKLKPVGTVWIAVGNKNQVFSKKFMFTPFREENIELTSIMALNMLKNFIQ